jgi:hypothetical protein
MRRVALGLERAPLDGERHGRLQVIVAYRDPVLAESRLNGVDTDPARAAAAAVAGQGIGQLAHMAGQGVELGARQAARGHHNSTAGRGCGHEKSPAQPQGQAGGVEGGNIGNTSTRWWPQSLQPVCDMMAQWTTTGRRRRSIGAR